MCNNKQVNESTLLFLGFSPMYLTHSYKQVDADYKLQDMKKMIKELEMKEKGYKKKLEDLNNSLSKHMEQ